MDKVSMGDVSGPCDWVAIASLQPAYIEVKSGRLHLRRSDEETHREDALLANGSLCTATPRFSAPFLKCRALLTQRPDLRSGLCKPWLYLFTRELKYWKEILCFQISNIERKYFVSISIIEISYCVATSNIERKYSVHNLKYKKNWGNLRIWTSYDAWLGLAQLACLWEFLRNRLEFAVIVCKT